MEQFTAIFTAVLGLFQHNYTVRLHDQLLGRAGLVPDCRYCNIFHKGAAAW